MKENLHIDEAVRQEVGKGSFPYQEAHWEALAAQLPGKKAILWWRWVLAALLLGGLGLALWQPWSQGAMKKEIAFVAPVSGIISTEGANISFVPRQAKPVFNFSFSQKEKPAQVLLEEASTAEPAISLLPTVRQQKMQIDSTLAATTEFVFSSIPRRIKYQACPACQDSRKGTWSLQFWSTPVLAGRNLIDELQNPNSALIIRQLDSLEGNLWGMAYGIQLQKRLNKRLGVNLGINWTEMGYDFNDSLIFFPPAPENPTNIRYAYRYTYMQAELGANYLIKRQRPALYGSLSLAPSWMLDFRRKRTLYYEDKDPEVKIDDLSTAEFRSFNLYGKAGFGLIWPGNAKMNIMLEPAFTYGFIPLARDAEFNRALWGWQVRTGIVVRL